MFKLWASIKKDWRIFSRDRVGLALMFIMPIVLALVITTVQNSTFELVNDKKIPLILLNKDTTGNASAELIAALQKGGMFRIKEFSRNAGTLEGLKNGIQNKHALVGIVIPETYTSDVTSKAESIAAKALQGISVTEDTTTQQKITTTPLELYYHPILQKSFRDGVNSALNSTLQIVQSKYIVRQLYSGMNDSAAIPADLEQQILSNETPIHQLAVSRQGGAVITNATQHNIPAWTVFAMFFIVISLGSSIVREKNSGSFIRLKTLPTSIGLALTSKQISYIFITVLQAIIIFSIGRWVFPLLGLPSLYFPDNIIGLLLVVIICGWCATAFAMMIGVLAKTQEQCNGIGAIVIVLFAAIGGLLVPAFAMPASMQTIMKVSPLHWCLEAFYALFLEGGGVKYLIKPLLPVVLLAILFKVITRVSMRQQKLV